MMMGRLGVASSSNGAVCKLSRCNPSNSVSGTKMNSVMVAQCLGFSGHFQKTWWALSAPPSSSRSTEGKSNSKCSTPRSTNHWAAPASRKGGLVLDQFLDRFSALFGSVRRTREGGAIGPIQCRSEANSSALAVMTWSSFFNSGCMDTIKHGIRGGIEIRFTEWASSEI